jgi:type II secretory pathway component PulM
MQPTEYKAAQQRVALGQMRACGRQLTEAQQRALDAFMAEFGAAPSPDGELITMSRSQGSVAIRRIVEASKRLEA